ncbi:glycosyltransferase family 4 protein [Hyphomicrobium sp. CS1GBMeth3]|uniref:glycosyltransferase family 4 protein n=1 Tax=Hyphomicrobium sp. CS1GBMeth3 TaxID=1892845 RepID=UPI000931F8AE|nr:glycosyltransferase family 4 protein [Hyphomicrobium sp. CS1GBMeth3]
MRIAQIAPLAEAIPPKFYGGSERVVSWLTEELVRRGHDVTLFASGDSLTDATLVPGAPAGLRLSGIKDHLASNLVMLSEVRSRASEFDVIHFHTDLLQYPIFEPIGDRTITTMHGRLDLPDFMPVYKRFSDMPRVSISNAQRTPAPENTNWLDTIYHGFPADLFPFSPKGGPYLAFLGRISPEKRPDRAIEIAVKAGIPLKIAAKVDPVDTAYFENVIEPMLDHPLVEYIGEINDRKKGEFLGNALALLFPIDWIEPFGLVMIEAMACGTPVIGWRNGSVPEVLEDGVTGFVIGSIDEAVEVASRVGALDRARVRNTFERRFTVEKMTDRYVAAYERLAGVEHKNGRAVAQPILAAV